MIDPLPLIDAALRGALIAMLLLFGGVLLRDRSGSAVARVGMALALGLCVQAFSSAPIFEAQAPLVWQAPLVGVATANSVLFWLFASALFDDDFALRPAHGAAWLLVAGLSTLNCSLLASSPGSPAPAASLLLRGLPLPFALLAIRAAVLNWQVDLVESRRRVRIFIVVAGSVYTLAQLTARLSAPQGRLSAPVALLDMLALLALAAFVLWHLLRLSGAELFLPVPLAAAPETAAVATPPESPDPADQRLAEALQALMTDGRAYCADDCSLATLAARLNVPEYRLRRLINQRLGHRNFNAFVNSFRLEEARTALADPARRAQPVLSIALDSGFQSIGPFNRAFKAATGLTPSEFRKEKLAET